MPSGFGTATIGDAQSQEETFSMIPLDSNLSNSCPMASRMANGTARGLWNHGVAPGHRERLTLLPVKVPRPD